MSDKNKLDAIVRLNKIIFQKETFHILSVTDIKTFDVYIIKGDVLDINYGQDYRLIAEYVADKKYGGQYNITLLTPYNELNNRDDFKKFLMYYVAPSIIDSIFDTLGQPIEAIKNGNIEELCKAKGVQEFTANRIIEKYKENENYYEAFTQLGEYGLTVAMIKKILLKYKSVNTALAKLKTNPYELVTIPNVGWFKADEIAQKMGFDKMSKERLAAFIRYFLNEQAQIGNSWLTPKQLTNEISTMYAKSGISVVENKQEVMNVIKVTFQEMHDNKILHWNNEKTFMCLSKYYNLELKVANELKRLLSAENKFKYDDLDVVVKEIEAEKGYTLTDEQINAIKIACENNVMLITGAAGCVDMDTEYFNGEGWKKISEYVEGERVLQYNEDGTAELVYPLRYIKQPQDYLWHFKTKYGLDQCLSDEHNVIYIADGSNNIRGIKMNDLIKKHNQNINGFKNKFITTYNFKSDDNLELSDLEIKLMCVIICDGKFDYSTNTNYCRIALKKERKKERLENILNSLNLPYKKSKYKNSEEYDTYSFYAPIKTKVFDSNWYKCNHSQLEVIVSEILYWDGYQNGKKKCFYTTIKQNADFVQWAFASCGYRASINMRNRVGQKTGINNTAIRRSVEYDISISNTNLISMYKKTPITQYKTLDGFEYCFTVPSSMLVLRRNDKIFITGNCGKTSSVSGVLKALPSINFAQCSLSGKAASNLEDVTGKKGYTIHRLLGYNPSEGFIYNKERPLSYDMIILDEISMVGGELFLSLLEAIPSGSKLIMLGDHNQLSSIGTMNILKDLLNNYLMPRQILTKIHRQAQRSAIITESFKVKDGEQITGRNFNGIETRGELQDFTLDIYDDKNDTLKKIIHHFEKEYERLQDINKIQIIVPMRERGDCSAFNINNKIQDIYNPLDVGDKFLKLKRFGKDLEFRIGDKVINRKNSYGVYDIRFNKKDIFNGYIGIISNIDEKGKSVTINFNNEEVGEIVITGEQLQYIELAYCVTTHLFQGSQCDTVIVGLDYSSYKLLSKELIYTAMSRAQKKLILCAENKALRYAISESSVSIKQTFLSSFLDMDDLELVEITNDEYEDNSENVFDSEDIDDEIPF